MNNMNIFGICEVLTVVAAIIAMRMVKSPTKCIKAMADTFFVFFIVWLPFSCIQTLAVFGIELFDTSFKVPWAFAPLDILSSLSLFFLMRVAIKKSFSPELESDLSKLYDAAKQEYAEQQPTKQQP